MIVCQQSVATESITNILSDLLQHKVLQVNGWIQRLELFKNIVSSKQSGVSPADYRITGNFRKFLVFKCFMELCVRL